MDWKDFTRLPPYCRSKPFLDLLALFIVVTTVLKIALFYYLLTSKDGDELPF